MEHTHPAITHHFRIIFDLGKFIQLVKLLGNSICGERLDAKIDASAMMNVNAPILCGHRAFVSHIIAQMRELNEIIYTMLETFTCSSIT